ALADFSGRKKAFLVGSTLLTIAATAALYFVGPGDVALGMAMFIIGNFGFEVGYVFYNAFLPEVSTPENVGRVSGWGWATGYVGGLVCLMACRPLISQSYKTAAGGLDQTGISAYQLSFLLVAGFYLVFALPAFLLLKESPAQGEAKALADYVMIGFRRVGDTLRHLKHYKETAKFILASLFFTDGITTVIGFAGIYATTTMKFTSDELVWLFLVLNIAAFPGSLAAGYLADIMGPRKTLIATLLVWLVVVSAAGSAGSKAAFWGVAVGAAIGMGSTQAVGRSFMSQITPPSRAAEFFGFYVLSGKFASMFGPLIFGFVSSRSGSQRIAVLSLLPLFLLGLGLMIAINEKRALEAAKE
ncbi:MAG: MFS transporter, partial [Bryobacteraceae bacterium]|nr:MFS transporter [Bryobacteraceae bacterium]